MAIVTTSQNLTAVSYTAGEIIEIRNGATLTINSTPATRPGTIQCITSGKLRIENASATVPVLLDLNDMTHDLRFEAGGVLEVRGAPMSLAAGTGAAQTYDFTVLFGGVIKTMTYVEVEEVAGGGVFMPWPVIQEDTKFNLNTGLLNTIGGAAPASFAAGNTDAGKVLFWHETNRTLRCGDGTNGAVIPTGCAVRIPNIYVSNRLLTNSTSILQIVTTGVPTGGTFQIEFRSEDNSTLIGTTAAIAFNATAAAIDTAVEAVLGAGTVTNSGGPLPTAVVLTFAGAYANIRPCVRIVNNALTGGSNSQAHAIENATTNMSLIDLSPLGTMDAEWVSFSDKIHMITDTFKSVRLIACGFGSSAIQLNSSNGSVEIDGLANSRSPFVTQSTMQLSGILGTVTAKRIVAAAKSPAAFSFLTLPGLTLVDRITSIIYGQRNATSNRALIFQTLPANLKITNSITVGSGIAFTNLTNATVANWKYADGTMSAQITTNTQSAAFTINCVNTTFAGYSDAGPMAPRSYTLVSTDAASSGLKILGAVSNASDNALGSLLMQCGGLEMVNVTVQNMRGGPFIDLPTTYLANNLTARKVFGTFQTAQSATGLDACQGGIYDMVSSSIVGITETFSGVNDFVGGNYTDPSLTPTTGHVTFGPFGEGAGLALTGAAFTDALGGLLLPANGDTAVVTMPFAMHGITGFQNVAPYLFVDAPGAIANVAVVGNPGGTTGGTFTISVFDATNTLIGTTAAIAFNASTSTVDAAIEAIAGIGAGQITVGGSLAAGYTITFGGTLAGQLFIVTADGTSLTGGELPGVAYAVGRARLLTGTETLGAITTAEFAMHVPGTSYPAYAALTGANLVSAFGALTGYAAGGSGLEMRIRITSGQTNPFTRFNQISLPTNVDPTLWTVGDATITLQGPNLTDVVKVLRFSDDAVLYTFTGAGEKSFTVGANFDVEAYFRRETLGGTVLMRTLPETQRINFGNNGTVSLFYGAEVQLAQSSDVVAIRQKVDAYLDATISSRLAAAGYTTPPTASAIRTEIDTNSTKLDVAVSSRNAIAPDNSGIAAIKAKTDNLPASPAATGDIPSAATNATAVRSELATELGRIDVATSTRLATSAYTTPPTASDIRTEIDANSTKLDVAVGTRLATSGYTAPPTVSAIRTEIDTNSTKLDVATSTRLAASAYTTPPTASANATAVRSELATELGRIDVAVSSRNATAPDNASIAAIKAKTDNLPASPAAVSDVPTASANATAVRSELTTELGRIDVATSTRLAASAYTAAPTASAIRTEIDTNSTKLDVAVGTRLATSGYTAPPTVSAIRTEIDTNSTKLDVATSTRLAASAYTAAPTASANATAVRSELATELGRIDVATSTRLATSEYTVPPTASANATAVRTNLTTELGRIDVATSTRLAASAYTAPPTASAIRTEIDTNSTKLDVATSTRLASAAYTTPPTAAANATAVRTNLSTELGRIDVATSTRLASASYSAPPTASAIRTEIDTNSTKLDVAVGTRLASASYTAPPTASAIRTEIDTNSTKLDVAVSSRNSVAPDNASIAAIKAKTDNLPSDPADESSLQAAIAAIPAAPSASQVATQVRSELATELGRIDVATSTRLAAAAYTAAPSASAIRTEIDTNSTKLDVATSTRLAAAAYSAAPSASANATAVRSELSTELSRIDVATGTRLASASYTAPPTPAAIRTEIDSNSTKLDVAVGTRLASVAYTTPPTAAAIRTEIDSNSTKLDAAVSSRALETTAQAIKTKVDELPAHPASEEKAQEAVDAAKLAAALSA